MAAGRYYPARVPAALAETRFGLPPARSATTNNQLADLMIEHARNLKAVEATTEKLNRELGDF